MAAYDKNKDVESVSWVMEDNIRVSVHQYDGGDKKLQIVRMFVKKDGEIRYGKLGRMIKEEVEWLQLILPHAVPAMTETEEEDTPVPENEEQTFNL